MLRDHAFVFCSIFPYITSLHLFPSSLIFLVAFAVLLRFWLMVSLFLVFSLSSGMSLSFNYCFSSLILLLYLMLMLLWFSELFSTLFMLYSLPSVCVCFSLFFFFSKITLHLLSFSLLLI